MLSYNYRMTKSLPIGDSKQIMLTNFGYLTANMQTTAPPIDDPTRQRF